MSASDFVDGKLLNATFENQDPSTDLQLANIWVALFTVTPTKAGGGTEVSGNAYARVSTAPTDWTVSGSPFVAQNANTITFPTATPAGWGTIVAVGLFDAATVGNLMFFSALSVSLVVLASETFSFSASNLSFTGA